MDDQVKKQHKVCITHSIIKITILKLIYFFAFMNRYLLLLLSLGWFAMPLCAISASHTLVSEKSSTDSNLQYHFTTEDPVHIVTQNKSYPTVSIQETVQSGLSN